MRPKDKDSHVLRSFGTHCSFLVPSSSSSSSLLTLSYTQVSVFICANSTKTIRERERCTGTDTHPYNPHTKGHVERERERERERRRRQATATRCAHDQGDPPSTTTLENGAATLFILPKETLIFFNFLEQRVKDFCHVFTRLARAFNVGNTPRFCQILCFLCVGSQSKMQKESELLCACGRALGTKTALLAPSLPVH